MALYQESNIYLFDYMKETARGKETLRSAALNNRISFFNFMGFQFRFKSSIFKSK